MLTKEKVIIFYISWYLIYITYIILLNLEKQKTTSLLKSQNKRQKGNVKGVKNDEFQQQIQELEIEERKEELERKKLDNQLKKLEIARKEKELREGQWSLISIRVKK